jgi:KUP system potassium uptake protein
VIALIVFSVLMTWQRGREIVTANRSRAEGSLRDFVEELSSQELPVRQVHGVGVFLSQDLDTTPLALRANVERNHVLHDHVILVSVKIERVPHVPNSERVVAVARRLRRAHHRANASLRVPRRA